MPAVEPSPLSDRQALTDLAGRYAWAVDSRDWPLLRTCFAARITADFVSLVPGRAFQGPAEEWVGQIRALIDGMDATQHLLGQHMHWLDGDRARAVVYMQATHVLANEQGDPSYTIGGHYDFSLRREPDGGWLIAAYALKLAWRSGNRAIFRLASKRTQARGQG